MDEGFVSEDDLVANGKAARVKRDLCVACLTCVRVCPWQIPKIDELGVAVIDPRACRACGICPSECPAGAIELNRSEDEKLLAAAGSGK